MVGASVTAQCFLFSRMLVGVTADAQDEDGSLVHKTGGPFLYFTSQPMTWFFSREAGA